MFQLTGVVGIVNADLSDLRINDGASDVSTGGTPSISGTTGTITFTGNFSVPAGSTVNYTLIGDVVTPIGGDRITVGLGTANITLLSGTKGGFSPASVTQSRDYPYSYPVAAGPDDSYSTASADDASNVDQNNWIYVQRSGTSSSRVNMGVRFQNATIPQGSIINRAEFRGYIYDAASSSAWCTIFGNLTNNSQNFDTVPQIQNTTSRPRTTASTAWQQANMGAGWQDKEVTAIVQEIVSQGTWEAGNKALTLLFIADSVTASPSRAEFRSYNYGSFIPILNVDYTLPNTVIIGSHSGGQAPDAFDGNLSQNDVDLYRFSLFNTEASAVTVDQIVFSLSAVSGIETADLSDLRIWDGTSYVVAGGTPSISSGTGTITFTTTWTIPAASTVHYTLRGDVANLVKDDTLTLSLVPAGVALVSGDVGGSVSATATHTADYAASVAEHGSGQLTDQLDGAPTQNDKSLFRFRLVNATVGDLTVDQVVLQLSSVTGIADTDLTDLRISNGTIDVSTGGVASIAAGSGTVTFSGDFTLPSGATVDYTVLGDVAGVVKNDTLTVGLGAANVTLAAGVVGGTAPTGVTHTGDDAATLGNHAAGQVTDQFDSATAKDNAVLFRFQLVNTTAVDLTVDQVQFQLSAINGIATSDLSDLRIHNGTLDVATGGTASISAPTGTITFTGDFTLPASGTVDYALLGDVANLVPSKATPDTITVGLGTANVTLAGGSVGGSAATNAAHARTTRSRPPPQTTRTTRDARQRPTNLAGRRSGWPPTARSRLRRGTAVASASPASTSPRARPSAPRPSTCTSTATRTIPTDVKGHVVGDAPTSRPTPHLPPRAHPDRVSIWTSQTGTGMEDVAGLPPSCRNWSPQPSGHGQRDGPPLHRRPRTAPPLHRPPPVVRQRRRTPSRPTSSSPHPAHDARARQSRLRPGDRPVRRRPRPERQGPVPLPDREHHRRAGHRRPDRLQPERDQRHRDGRPLGPAHPRRHVGRGHRGNAGHLRGHGHDRVHGRLDDPGGGDAGLHAAGRRCQPGQGRHPDDLAFVLGHHPGLRGRGRKRQRQRHAHGRLRRVPRRARRRSAHRPAGRDPDAERQGPVPVPAGQPDRHRPDRRPGRPGPVRGRRDRRHRPRRPPDPQRRDQRVDRGVASIAAGSGTISFTGDFNLPAGTAVDYTVIGDVANIVKNDTLTIALGTGSVSLAAGVLGRLAPTNATHTGDDAATLGNHTSGQVGDQFDSATAKDDAALFRFRLVNATAVDLTVDQVPAPALCRRRDRHLRPGRPAPQQRDERRRDRRHAQHRWRHRDDHVCRRLHTAGERHRRLHAPWRRREPGGRRHPDDRARDGQRDAARGEPRRKRADRGDAHHQRAHGQRERRPTRTPRRAPTTPRGTSVCPRSRPRPTSPPAIMPGSDPGIYVPKGSTVSSATLSVYVDGNDDPQLRIFGNLVANAPDFSSGGNVQVFGRARTTSNTVWRATNVGAGWKNLDVAAVVNEIVNQASWAGGNALALMMVADATVGPLYTVQFRSWDYDAPHTYAATLTIGFTPPTTLVLGNHASGQATDQFDGGVSQDDKDLYRFRIENTTGAAVTVDQIVFNLERHQRRRERRPRGPAHPRRHLGRRQRGDAEHLRGHGHDRVHDPTGRSRRARPGTTACAPTRRISSRTTPLPSRWPRPRNVTLVSGDVGGSVSSTATHTADHTVFLAQHGSGQLTDQLDGSPSRTGVPLFRFRLTNNSQAIVTVDQVVLPLTGVAGVVNGDVSGLRIHDGTTDVSVGGTPSISGATGTFTFDADFTLAAAATVDYTVYADLSSLVKDDTLTLALATGNVTLAAGSVSGSAPSNATHAVDYSLVLAQHGSGPDDGPVRQLEHEDRREPVPVPDPEHDAGADRGDAGPAPALRGVRHSGRGHGEHGALQRLGERGRERRCVDRRRHRCDHVLVQLCDPGEHDGQLHPDRRRRESLRG